MRLMKEGLMPPWALGFFSDFKHAEPSKRPVEEIAMVHEQFLLLAPVEIEGGWEGLMLAEHAVSGQQVEVSYQGGKVRILAPEFEDFVIVKAAEVDLVRPL